MNFNNHSNLVGQHAFLSASKYHWINYTNDKLITTFRNWLAVQRGTELHELASYLINLNVKLPKSKKTLNMFVNDAIGFKMDSEQVLYYSDNCFGTADAISFKKNFLRIHDLKTGQTQASMNQLKIYAALFCLEYHVKPSTIFMELRIYQYDDILIENSDTNENLADEVTHIMDKIITFDKCIEQIKIGG